MGIRLIKATEQKQLMLFIGKHWCKNHILSVNKKLLDWQYLQDSTYNFVAGTVNNEFKTILGFIPKRHFDPAMENDIWCSIWCKAPDSPKGLGIRLMSWIEDTYKPDAMISIGMNDGIVSLYKRMGWKTGTLNHWYFSNGRLAGFSETEKPIRHKGKSIKYCDKRYFNNPFYTYYNVNGIIYRVADAEGYKCILIVDMLKDAHVIGYDLMRLLEFHKAEHISCLNFGIHKSYFLNMGFIKKPDNIKLPLHFEPLSFEKQEIKFAYKSDKPIVVFRGDGDQDRPNIIKT